MTLSSRLAQRWLAVSEKEHSDRARELAEFANRAASAEKAIINRELNKSKEELIKERDNARESAKAAQHAQVRAEENERLARKAGEEAVAAQAAMERANREMQNLLQKERDRVATLQDSLGSLQPIRELKK